jgi:hypothetical protein
MRIVRPHPVISFGLGLGSLGVAQVLDPSTTSTIAAKIQQIEGYYPGTVAYANNNPGNLVFAGQSGATLGAGGFARFATYSDGLNALNDQIQLYAGRGMSIQDMMNVYAPASPGNNPVAYANQVADALGVDPSTQLLTIGMSPDLAAAGAVVLPDTGFLASLSSLDPATIGFAAVGLLAIVLIGNRN